MRSATVTDCDRPLVGRCCTEADKVEVFQTHNDLCCHSKGAHGFRASSSQHAVEHCHRHGRLSLLTKPVACTQPWTNDCFVSAHGGPSANLHRLEIDFKFMARRLTVLWSGAFRSTHNSSKIEAISPSVCRSGWRNTRRSIRLVSIARSE